MRNDQPFAPINYNTDQFIDPHTGLTVHDDGSDFYIQPDTDTVYLKLRIFNGFFPDALPSYQIILTPGSLPLGINAYTTEDGTAFYVAEDGTTVYVQES